MPMFFQSLRWVNKFMSAWISLETNTQQKRLFKAPGFEKPAVCRARHQFSLVLAALGHHSLKSVQRTENYSTALKYIIPSYIQQRFPQHCYSVRGFQKMKKWVRHSPPSLKSWHWVWNQYTVEWIQEFRPLQSWGLDSFLEPCLVHNSIWMPFCPIPHFGDWFSHWPAKDIDGHMTWPRWPRWLGD